MTSIASFEVLAQPIVPGIPNVPYVQQGSFVQVTNIVGTLTVSLIYYPSQPFVASSGAVTLFANYINGSGEVTQIPAAEFVSNRGFFKIPIPSLETFIFGVQYVVIPGSSDNVVGGTPQDGVATRGVLLIEGSQDLRLTPLVTIRQVFNNYNSSGNLQDVSEAAYAVPVDPLSSAARMPLAGGHGG